MNIFLIKICICIQNRLGAIILSVKKVVLSYLPAVQAIEEQDLSLGLPFNSFENTVKSQMELSADINDLAESLGIVSNL